MTILEYLGLPADATIDQICDKLLADKIAELEAVLADRKGGAGKC